MIYTILGTAKNKFLLKVSLITLSFIVMFTGQTVAQTATPHFYSNSFKISKDTTILSQKTIVSESVEIASHFSDCMYDFTVIPEGILIKSCTNSDSVTLTYRTLALNLHESTPILDPEDITKKSRIIKIANDYSNDEASDRRFIQSNKLEYTGSFSRGINFGNSQDLVLNSDFNLQMVGDLGNGLLIRAAISDDNIPIQPEGNTQVLQEFDKVFIEVQKDRTRIIAGDYELDGPDSSYFMRYYKKLKGVSVSNVSSSDKGWQLDNKGSFAISRGKFKRLLLKTSEGNQGPYRLEGDAGEVFLQVLSGTEKVYADGQLLKRGENFDYVIDYNRAEIRFTPNTIITENKRIIVEYEFATQNYLRSLYATESTFKKGRWKADLNYYNEQDSKSLTGNIELDSIDINAFQESGDRGTSRPGTFIPQDNDFTDLTKYQVINGILVHAPDATENILAARFSFVGSGNGNYVIDTEAEANGRVYKFEAGGDYSSDIQLIAPEKKQLITAGMSYAIKDSTEVRMETAMSHLDLNRFSTLDNDDNIGLAGLFSISNTKLLKKAKSDSIIRPSTFLTTETQVEYRQKTFSPLNPYRPIEFTRDWNLTRLTESNDQVLHNSTINLSKGLSHLAYTFSGFHDQDNYSGLKHAISTRHRWKKFLLDGEANYLHSKSEFLAEKSQFARPKFTLEYALSSSWQVGTYYEKERNIIRNTTDASLSDLSFNYDHIKGYISSSTEKEFSITASVTRRIDDKYFADIPNRLSRASVAMDYSIGGAWRKSSNSDLQWNITLRDFKDKQILDGENSKQTLLGTIEHRLNFLNKGVLLNTYYESNSGQEPKVEFQYIKVQRGEGSYIWVDSNMDSITQVYEFEVANFADEGDYEKISIFNNEFIISNNSILNQSLKIIPKKFLANKKGILSRFQLGTRYRIDQRSQNDSVGSLITPIILDINAPELISYNTTVDTDIFWNRGESSHDIQLSYRTIQNKVQQVTDDVRRSTEEWFTRSRYNIVKSVDAILETGIGSKDHRSNFIIQDYDIDYWRVVPQLNIRPSTKFRFIAKYRIERNSNTLDSIAVEAGNNQESLQQDLGLEFTWRKSVTSNLQFSTNFVIIKMEGNVNPSVTFEMLQGLKAGNNFLWNINYTRRIAKNFDMILTYNARKSEGSRMIHNAGAQLRAIF